ncbi:MAG TPA: hypothetical protein VGM67_12645 [Gemmatimonadaceae bacterium]|jgi:hypothetical protein
MSKYSLLLVAGFLVATRAAAQSNAPAGVTIAGDREASAALASIVETTRSKGLPIDPILAKVRYALVVRPQPAPARIVASARDMAVRLEVARDALAPHPSANDIAAGEAALHYVPRDVLTRLRSASPRDSSVAVPLGVLTQLVSNGISVKRAADIVTSLVKHGVSGQLLAALSNDVNSDVQRGGRPDDALDVRLRGLTAALAPAGANAVAADIAITTGSTVPASGKPRP